MGSFERLDREALDGRLRERAIERSAPVPTLADSLFGRFASQKESVSAKVIAAPRNQFGGHAVKTR